MQLWHEIEMKPSDETLQCHRIQVQTTHFDADKMVLKGESWLICASHTHVTAVDPKKKKKKRQLMVD